MKRRRVWIPRAILLAAIFGLVWLLSQIGWTKILEHLTRIGWRGWTALIAIGVAEEVWDALALRKATLGKISFWRVFFLNQAGSALNTLFPAEAGEFFKASLLSRHVPGKAASATLVWNVAYRLSKSLVIVLAGTAAFFFLPAWRPLAAPIVGFGFLGVGAYAGMSYILRRGWIGGVATRLARLPWIRHERIDRLAARARQAEQKAGLFRREHPKRYLAIIASQIAARMTALSGVWLALHLLHVTDTFPLSALIYAGTQLLTYLLILFPTRVGTTEGSTYLFFVSIGLDGGVGVIFQIVMRLKQIAVNSISLLSAPLFNLPHTRLPPDRPRGEGPPSDPRKRHGPAPNPSR